jgi:hypothetical protein
MVTDQSEHSLVKVVFVVVELVSVDVSEVSLSPAQERRAKSGSVLSDRIAFSRV